MPNIDVICLVGSLLVYTLPPESSHCQKLSRSYQSRPRHVVENNSRNSGDELVLESCLRTWPSCSKLSDPIHCH
ncbi:uncharacterized protein YALI1_C02424g [Yarrowia lipolytica]|uniref:Uncharacterized protein n=1 Tax=Yarrowia lipolytica TaxID=4952 RepID=A0A1D8N9B9_YARLL|nr:hypothetical protein YALI1_C02424g [Yarrowia lipolytica]